ncbi:unnamed protein product, partial [Hymenolepis diminuta]
MAKIGRNILHNCYQKELFAPSRSFSIDRNPRGCPSSLSDKHRHFPSFKRNVGTYSKPNPREQRISTRNIIEKTSDKKPAWYNEGPDNLDELMDFDDMKIPQINDKAIYKIECSDTSKKEIGSKCIKTTDSDNNLKFRVLGALSKTAISSIKVKQNQLKIHTLREIESCLDVHIHNQEHTCDLSAFNKLLDIVGLRTNSGLDCEPKISKTTVKDDNIDSEKVNPSKNGNSTFNETKCTPAKNFNTYPKCYPSHLLNHTNLGNTFRWYRAMANAASANAFIYQNIDSFSNFESEAQGSQDNGYPYLGYDTEPGQSCENYDYNNQEYFCQNTLGFPINNYVKKVANGLLNPIELQNSGKSFGRQSLQPFLLQQLLRQQQIAKC